MGLFFLFGDRVFRAVLASLPTCFYKNIPGPTSCHPGYILSAWVFREGFRLDPWPEVLSQAGLLGVRSLDPLLPHASEAHG